MREAPWARSAFWMYTVLVHRADVRRHQPAPARSLLAEAGIQTRPLWQPLHLSAAHRGAFAVDCSVAERLYRQALSLPCSVGLSSVAQAMVISAFTAHLSPAAGGRGGLREVASWRTGRSPPSPVHKRQHA